MNHLYEQGVEMTMRDGTVLRADVWRPLEGHAPTLLMRTPYNRRGPFLYGGPGTQAPGLLVLVNAGYAVVLQDARGTFSSDGTFEPKVNEIADGQDTVAWIREQGWSDGSVGMYGASYMGMVQWAAAIAETPGLKAIAPTFAATDWYSELWYSTGGALSLGLVTMWNALTYAADEQRGLERGTITDPSHLMQLAGSFVDPLPLNDPTPVADLQVLGKGRWADDWLAHPDFDDYWRSQDWSQRLDAVAVPVLSTGGWYDLKVNATIADWVRVREHGASEVAREQSRLVVGPWDHGNLTGLFPARYFGALAAGDLDASHVAFFDHHLKGTESETPMPRVRIFVMGIDEWRDESDWPLPDTVYADHYLDSQGAANTKHGDGVLRLEAPEVETHDTFRYDPRDPVPTAGGALLPSVPGLIGPVDQGRVDGRQDVLCYTGPILDEPVEVTGHVELKVFVSASTVDADITAKLVDVFPDGRAINLCDGILRLRYRKSLAEPELLAPGEVYDVTVPMSVTSNVFLPGHRIRLDVSGSNFPRYDRNSNTGGRIATEALEDMVPTDVTVYHGTLRPSRLGTVRTTV